MILKAIKYGAIGTVAFVAIGGLLFGGDLVSYVQGSYHQLRNSVKDSVPIEFELQRARNQLEEIVPEMHANIKLIAKEEVEIAQLEKDIHRTAESLADQKQGIAKLSGMLREGQVVYTVSGTQYPRETVKDDLSRRFERYKEAEMVLEGKKRLLVTRRKALAGAMQMLDRAKSQKALLEDKIESLVAQHRMIQAAAVGSKIQVDDSKLARTEKLIARIQKRLDVAERVLAHEGRFVEGPVEVDLVEEADLLTQIDEHFGEKQATEVAAREGIALPGE